MAALPIRLIDRLFALGHDLFLTCPVKGNLCTLLDPGVSATVPLIERQLKELGVGPEEMEEVLFRTVYRSFIARMYPTDYIKPIAPLLLKAIEK